MSIEPALSARMRFVHIHINLLGFMTMMIAGVAYHVLPRFNARTVPWPNGVKYHFYLQNIGVIGMVITHAAGGNWREGALHWLFVLFALITALSLVFMFYNLFFMLTTPKVDARPRDSTDKRSGPPSRHGVPPAPWTLQQGPPARASQPPAADRGFPAKYRSPASWLRLPGRRRPRSYRGSDLREQDWRRRSCRCSLIQLSSTFRWRRSHRRPST